MCDDIDDDDDDVGEHEHPGIGELDDEGLFFCIRDGGLADKFALWENPSPAHRAMRGLTTNFIERAVPSDVSRILAVRAPHRGRTDFLANAAAAYIATYPGCTVAIVAPSRTLREHIAKSVHQLATVRYSPFGELPLAISPAMCNATSFKDTTELRFRFMRKNVIVARGESTLALLASPSAAVTSSLADIAFVHHSATRFGDPVATAAASQLSRVVVSFHN